MKKKPGANALRLIKTDEPTMQIASPKVSLGLEELLSRPLPVLRQRRIGLLMNQASVTGDGELACDALARGFPGHQTCIFSPQHGIWAEQQANMIESRDTIYKPLGLPVYSLYSDTRRPTARMLEEIDVLVIDLQDVGTRVYTFIWTMLECLRACARAGKAVAVLDRPNPLGGVVVEGPGLAADHLSFVGGHPIPLRHALTLAECAQLFVRELALDVELHVVPMQGWRRSMLFADTGLNWVWPSPNMPTPATALVYPGQVLLEGCNLSEGRGTTRPFEVIGAPFLDPIAWLRELREFEQPGLQLRPTRFVPTFDKWGGESCGGIDLRIVEPRSVRSARSTVSLICTAARLAPDEFCWLPPPYEYEVEKPPIDILFGSSELRGLLASPSTGAVSQRAMDDLLAFDELVWRERVEPVLLYP